MSAAGVIGLAGVPASAGAATPRPDPPPQAQGRHAVVLPLCPRIPGIPKGWYVVMKVHGRVVCAGRNHGAHAASAGMVAMANQLGPCWVVANEPTLNYITGYGWSHGWWTCGGTNESVNFDHCAQYKSGSSWVSWVCTGWTGFQYGNYINDQGEPFYARCGDWWRSWSGMQLYISSGVVVFAQQTSYAVQRC